MTRDVRVFAPATVANLGPGFDVLGMALSAPGDTVVARRVPGSGVRISSITGDGGRLPIEADSNTAGIAAREVLSGAGIDLGVELELRKGIAIGSGLGSSAASAAAAALAVNILAGSPFRKAELVAPCLEAEAEVAGRHADNVAPALLGGLVLIRSVAPLDIVRLPAIEGLTMAVVTPRLELSTREARHVLPERVPLVDAVRTTANLGGLISALHSGDLGLLARSMVDRIVTPARAGLIPGCLEVIGAALDAGALGSSISGAGPSVFALCRSRRSGDEVSTAMVSAFEAAGLESEVTVSAADCPGARKL